MYLAQETGWTIEYITRGLTEDQKDRAMQALSSLNRKTGESIKNQGDKGQTAGAVRPPKTQIEYDAQEMKIRQMEGIKRSGMMK